MLIILRVNQNPRKKQRPFLDLKSKKEEKLRKEDKERDQERVNR